VIPKSSLGRRKAATHLASGVDTGPNVHCIFLYVGSLAQPKVFHQELLSGQFVAKFVPVGDPFNQPIIFFQLKKEPALGASQQETDRTAGLAEPFHAYPQTEGQAMFGPERLAGNLQIIRKCLNKHRPQTRIA